jgi:hypothetical protein
MTACPRCGSDLRPDFRFCPWCAEPQRRKLVEFFRAHPRDRGKALRVSRYFGEEPQVRFSVWDETGVARAAVSLADDEADRLGRLLVATSPTQHSATWRERLEDALDRARACRR